MTVTQSIRSQPVAHFRSLARPLLVGLGEWGTERYEFGGLEVWARLPARAGSGSLYLYWVGALRPGQGEGAAGMRSLTEVADRAGLTLVLHADPWGPHPMERSTLRAWYERFGFAATSDDLVPYWPGRVGLAMCREPG